MNDGSYDWVDWHAPYSDPHSPLSQRLRIVQSHISACLDGHVGWSGQIVSVCAGQGRDLLGVLAARQDRARWSARLIELDPENAAIARERASRAGLHGAEVVCRDAGRLDAYAGAIPADLILMCGVFGNISSEDVRTTIATLPFMSRKSTQVIWTRSRRSPDLTPTIREWFAEHGFTEQAFEAPESAMFTVGMHRFDGSVSTVRPAHRRLFSFLPRELSPAEPR